MAITRLPVIEHPRSLFFRPAPHAHGETQRRPVRRCVSIVTAKGCSRRESKFLRLRALTGAKHDLSALSDAGVRRAIERAIMKTRYTVALSMIAGAALGGAAIQGLQNNDDCRGEAVHTSPPLPP